MTVTQIFSKDQTYEVTGTSFWPEGEILMDGKAVNLSEHPNLKKFLYSGIPNYCSRHPGIL